MAKKETKNIYLEKQLIDNLNKVITHVSHFMKKIESSGIEEEELSNIIYTNISSKSRKMLTTFSEKINKSEGILNKVMELQEESEMMQKKKKEIQELKNILNTNYQNLLKEENKLLLPSQEKIEEKEEDDILVEDTKDVENKNLLQKKRKNEKEKKEDKEEKEEDKKEKFMFKTCYICKKKLGTNNISKFYGSMCQKCGDYNYSFRTMQLDFKGRIAVVTGGRIKIGFYIVKKLLSYGCQVITTSRFPNDTLNKYKEDPDYDLWKNNLIIYPIDFRLFQSTVKFVNYIKDNFSHIDFLINNAAQTVRRNTEYYEYLLPIEIKKLPKEDDNKIIKNEYLELEKELSGKLIKEEGSGPLKKEEITKKYEKKHILKSLVSLLKKNNDPETEELLPLSVITSQIKIMEENEQSRIYIMGNDGQPYDFSKGKNSWNLELDEISFQEFTEVQIINAWTPYYLCAKLKPMMMKSPFPDKYIVNVTAVEGIFNHFKRTTHVHTNMAKAALNMLTRTCGKYLEKDKIYMTCVDTGWVSHMNEMNKIIEGENKDYSEFEMANVPLDELDGAMRVLHPIIEGIKNKNYLFGILLKDYVKSKW